MATISVSLPADGTTADVADVNTPITTIVNEFNGNIDNNNIKSGAAIATSKLADDAGITYAKLAAGVLVQLVSTNSSAVATGTTLIPYDDTIPQITEGTEIMTLAITPKATTNRLSIEATVVASSSVANHLIAAVFQDATASAIAAVPVYQGTATGTVCIKITHDMAAGTTSSTTFRVRIGQESAGTWTLNGQSTNRKFGGITISSMRIIETKV